MTIKLIKKEAVLDKTAKKHSSLYSDIKLGLFPSSIKIGPRAVAWIEHEVDSIIDARVKGLSETDIRDLVTEIHGFREVGGVK